MMESAREPSLSRCASSMHEAAKAASELCEISIELGVMETACIGKLQVRACQT